MNYKSLTDLMAFITALINLAAAILELLAKRSKRNPKRR